MWRPLKADWVLFLTTESLNRSRSSCIQTFLPNVLTHCPLRHICRLDSDRRPSLANRRSRRRWDKAYAALAVLAPALHRACGLATHQAAAARRDRGSVAAPQAADFPAGSPAAAPAAVPRLSADLLAGPTGLRVSATTAPGGPCAFRPSAC